MPFCPNCGAEIERGISFCPYCGGPVKEPEKPQVQMPEPPAAPEPPVQEFFPQPAEQPSYSQPYQQPINPSYEPVPPVATGGLLAWSIITLLLCTIPGIVAIVQTVGINKCTTVEAQQKKMSSARVWCIVGTILGILAIIGNVAAQSMN